MECNPRIDYPVLPYLSEHGYSNLRFFPIIDILEKGFPARAGQRWLSTRYHPHILAAAKGCSGSFISVDSGYYDVKHDAVIRMGSRWTQNLLGQPIPRLGLDSGMRFGAVNILYRLGEMSVQYILVWCELTVR